MSADSRIRALEQQLEEKEDKCFELEATLATTTAETEYAVREAKENAAKEVKHLQNQLRMAQQEATVSHSHAAALQKQLLRLKDQQSTEPARVSISPKVRSSRPLSSSSAGSASTSSPRRSVDPHRDEKKRKFMGSGETGKSTKSDMPVDRKIMSSGSRLLHILLETSIDESMEAAGLVLLTRQSVSETEVIGYIVEALVNHEKKLNMWRTLHSALSHASSETIQIIQSICGEGEEFSLGKRRRSTLRSKGDATSKQLVDIEIEREGCFTPLFQRLVVLTRKTALSPLFEYASWALQIAELIRGRSPAMIAELALLWRQSALVLLPANRKGKLRLSPSRSNSGIISQSQSDDDQECLNYETRCRWMAEVLRVLKNVDKEIANEVTPVVLDIVDWLREPDSLGPATTPVESCCLGSLADACVAFLRGLLSIDSSLLRTQHATYASTPQRWSRSLSAVQSTSLWLHDLVCSQVPEARQSRERHRALIRKLLRLLYECWHSLSGSSVCFSSLIPNEWLLLSSSLASVARHAPSEVEYGEQRMANDLLEVLQDEESTFLQRSG